jgi:hypothetical protein
MASITLMKKIKAKLVLVNFAHGKFYNKQRKHNSTSAKLVGGFDKVYEFSLTDIDSDFYDKNKSIFNIKKGIGLWLWKPYFLNRVLDKINYGDYMFHCDSSSIFLRSVKPLIKQMEVTGQDLMVYALPLAENVWTKPDLLNKMQVNNQQQQSNQISGSYFLLKKTDFTVKFIAEWLQLCQEEELLNDAHNEITQIPESFKEHRYDQSILSILTKKYNVIPFRDPSQYGEFPEMYRSHSKLVPFNNNNSAYKTSILLLRKSKISSELIKLFSKRFLKLLFPNIYKKIIS